jgi:hypothetical protein
MTSRRDSSFRQDDEREWRNRRARRRKRRVIQLFLQIAEELDPGFRRDDEKKESRLSPG